MKAGVLAEADAREVVVRRLRADDAVRRIAHTRPVPAPAGGMKYG